MHGLNELAWSTALFLNQNAPQNLPKANLGICSMIRHEMPEHFQSKKVEVGGAILSAEFARPQQFILLGSQS